MPKWITEGKTKQKDVVVSTRVRLARNLQDTCFPHRTEAEEAEKISQEIQVAVEQLPGADSFVHQRMREVDRLTRRVLMEQHYISPDLIKNKMISEYYLSEKENMTIMVNEEDHLRIQQILPGLQLEDCFDAVFTITKQLEEHLPFAWHREFGYLTACPTNTGTGLRASVMLHLPALRYSQQLKGILDSLGKVGITSRGIYGEGSEALGDLFQISNQRTLGYTEMEAVQKLQKVVESLIEQERNTRKAMMESMPYGVADVIFRSLGILKYARQLTAEETFTHLSHVRAGICMGILCHMDVRDIDNLMFHMQEYTIKQYKEQANLTAQDEVVRAEYVRNYFLKEDAHGKRQ